MYTRKMCATIPSSIHRAFYYFLANIFHSIHPSLNEPFKRWCWVWVFTIAIYNIIIIIDWSSRIHWSNGHVLYVCTQQAGTFTDIKSSHLLCVCVCLCLYSIYNLPTLVSRRNFFFISFPFLFHSTIIDKCFVQLYYYRYIDTCCSINTIHFIFYAENYRL